MTLPNFLIIGVAKAGTTSLYHYLAQHPQVYMSRIKETNFFAYEDARTGKLTQGWNGRGDFRHPSPSRFQVKTLQAYEALFAGVSTEIAIGEASPLYIFSPTAPQRIHDRIPNVKLVVCLRNPADRAFSGFIMSVRSGQAELSIRDRLTLESHHVKQGFYYDQLARYFDIFRKDQIKVYIFEDFKKNPAGIMADLFGFLGVETSFVVDTSIKYNPGAVPKSRWLNRLFSNSTMIEMAKSLLPNALQGMAKGVQRQNLKPVPTFPADFRAELIELYRADIRKLEGLLDRDLSIWLK